MEPEHNNSNSPSLLAIMSPSLVQVFSQSNMQTPCREECMRAIALDCQMQTPCREEYTESRSTRLSRRMNIRFNWFISSILFEDPTVIGSFEPRFAGTPPLVQFFHYRKDSSVICSLHILLNKILTLFCKESTVLFISPICRKKQIPESIFWLRQVIDWVITASNQL